ncbi:hypothetical protein U9M48_041765 [Paspalum notatum var. saurae]|uniref:Uncharacterized protein n=1 Tax=Paspalum notatum var. saurae TaxID=547442 RepID=A0AAQ3URA3_PASNO
MAHAAPAAPGHSSARGRETRRALLHPRFPPLLWALLRSRRHATSTWTRRRSPGCSSVRLSYKAPVPPLCDPTMWTRRWATARRRAAAGSCRARARRGLPSAKTRTRPRSCPWRRSGSTCSSTRAEQHVVPFAPRPARQPAALHAHHALAGHLLKFFSTGPTHPHMRMDGGSYLCLPLPSATARPKAQRGLRRDSRRQGVE